MTVGFPLNLSALTMPGIGLEDVHVSLSEITLIRLLRALMVVNLVSIPSLSPEVKLQAPRAYRQLARTQSLELTVALSQ